MIHLPAHFMEYFVQLVSALAWPLTIIAVALLFRQELRRAAARLSSVSYKEFRAEFDRELRAIEGEVQTLAVRGPQPLPSDQNSKGLPSYDRLIRIADISPRAAIMEAWREIELTTKQIANAYGLAPLKDMPGVRNVRELIQRKVLPSAAEGLYEGMRRLRSRAAHAADFAIEPDEAQRYIETALELQAILQFALKNTQLEAGKTA